MLLNQIFGIGFLVLGMVSISSYTENLAPFRLPLFYRELQPMKERWGHTLGTIIHVLEYVIVPLGFSLFFLMGMVFPQ